MAEPLKNQFFQPAYFDALSIQISQYCPDWSYDQFKKELYESGWEEMELKQRMIHASQSLGKCLPSDYPTAINILLEASNDVSGFDGILFSQFVMDHGLEYPEISLDTLEVFTCIGSAEFAIRPFIMKYEELTMRRMLAWSKHENVHVRRLSSEGCRPRLPWAPALPKFKADPSRIIPILENLKDDKEEYVQKSVANNLNDITKDNPATALSLLKKWNVNPSKQRTWIIKHALRSLIKEGNPEAISLVGYEKAPVKIERLNCHDEVIFGESQEFSFELINPSNSTAKYLIDYVIFHQKANGTLAPKVFKLGTYTLAGGEKTSISKRHSMVPITTRKYYAGEHKVGVQVNGELIAERPFVLIMN